MNAQHIVQYPQIVPWPMETLPIGVVLAENPPVFPRSSPFPAMKNELHIGDNLAVLRDKIRDESVDLVYLDPPFNSQQDYNVIFRERSGKRSTSQELVFEDTWRWSPKADDVCRELIEGGGRLSEAIRACRTFLGDSDMMAYIAMMAPRLKELHRVLKPYGAIYLHCDPTASHYLKLLMDGIFGPEHCLNEIVWKRTTAHSSAKRYGPAHDVLLYYRKSEEHTWNPHFLPHSDQYKAKFGKTDKKTGLAFQDHDLTGPGVRTGVSGQPWRGFDPTAKRRHWQIASYLYTKYKELTGKELKDYPLIERLDKLDEIGLIYWTEKKGGFPRYKQFLVDAAGAQLLDVWTDINPINSQAQERLGYPTQKPIALLKRIIEASSNFGDVILDPFSGCGTAVEAAEESGRHWIAIDVTHLAAAIIKQRLVRFGLKVFKNIIVEGEPVNVEEAIALAKENKFGFQCWAVGRLGAPPIEHRKGADRGIDGRIYFHDDFGSPKEIIISVKAGENLTPAFVRELRGVVEREKAAMGIFVCVKPPSREMLREAHNAGVYRSINRDFPKLQIITVEDIFANKPLNIPGRLDPYERKKPTAVRPLEQQLRLLP